MTGPNPQRLADVGPTRIIAYALLVGGAAYLLAAAYGPDGALARLALATVVGVAYAGTVHAIYVLRRGRPVR